MRGHAEAGHFLHLQLDVGVDVGVGEHAALGQEGTVLVQVVQGLVQAVADGRDLRVFLGRQVVQVLGGGFARVDLVLHAVQASHQQCCEGQVGVGGRIREARFDAAALRVGNVGDADRGRAVLGRVGQLHRGFETRHQALVRVRAGVGDGVQRAGVLDDAADVVQREVAQASVAVASEQVLAVLPDRLVNVHAGAVVAHQGLGHEGRGLAVGMGDVDDDVLLQLQPVSALNQRAELGADFHLAGVRHFVVMHFDRNAALLKDQAHLRAHVLAAVDRGHGEVAALDGGAVAAVAVLVFLGRVPGAFFGLDLEERAGHFIAPAHAVEDEELRLRTEESGVAQAGGLEISLGALGQRTRIALVGLAVGGVDHVAGQDQRRLFEEGVDVGGVGIGHEQHVRGFDALPAGDRGAVEGVTRRELVFIEMGNGHGDVLLLATGVGEAEVNELDFVVLHQLHHIGDGLGHQ
eukprot:m.922406 g.922406  ORF g.922406 m.922406 type:complete len:463 (+) comp98226_c0_seq1:811-2199(+)